MNTVTRVTTSTTATSNASSLGQIEEQERGGRRVRGGRKDRGGETGEGETGGRRDRGGRKGEPLNSLLLSSSPLVLPLFAVLHHAVLCLFQLTSGLRESNDRNNASKQHREVEGTVRKLCADSVRENTS